jgi:3-phosphoshikimate 1-carboxyvinyltransferase
MGARVEWRDDAITVAAPEDGRLGGVDIDLNDMPDAAMTLATIAVMAEGPTAIRNVGNWRVKETDRMAAMRAELTKLGAHVRVDGDDLTIIPPPGRGLKHAAIDTYDDHRMAMSFAILGLPPDSPGITINDPRCVEKTFPHFFRYLDRLRAAAH